MALSTRLPKLDTGTTRQFQTALSAFDHRDDTMSSAEPLDVKHWRGAVQGAVAGTIETGYSAMSIYRSAVIGQARAVALKIWTVTEAGGSSGGGTGNNWMRLSRPAS